MTLKGRYWTLFWLLLFLGVAFVVVGRQNTALRTAAHLSGLRDERRTLESRHGSLEAGIRRAESMEVLGPLVMREQGLVEDARNFEMLRLEGASGSRR